MISSVSEVEGKRNESRKVTSFFWEEESVSRT
jgi:hypothetical protein